MNDQEKKAFIISLGVAIGAALIATVAGYYAFKHYTKSPPSQNYPYGYMGGDYRYANNRYAVRAAE